MSQNVPPITLDRVIRDVDRLLRKRFEARIKMDGIELSRPQYLTLLHVHTQPGINQATLAELLEVEPMTVTGLIDRLERRGWIERRPDPADRRARSLHLTPNAALLAGRLRKLVDEWRADYLACLDETAQARLIGELQSLKDHLADPRPDEGQRHAAAGGC